MTNETQALIEQIEAKMADAKKGLITEAQYKADTDELKRQLTGLDEMQKRTKETDEAIASLKDVLAKQGDEVNALKARNAAAPEGFKSYGDQVGEQIKANAEAYNEFKRGNKRMTFTLNEKSAGTITASNLTNESNIVPVPALIPGYNPYRWNPATFLDYATVQNTNSAVIAWVDYVSPDGGPATTTAGSAKPATDFDNKVSKSSAIKVAGTIKVTEEMLDDVQFLAGQINDDLIGRTRLATSTNIYTYLTSNAGLTAVNAGMADFGGAAANMWQLIVCAKETIRKANHNANVVFLNPTDYARLCATKGIAEMPVIIGANSAQVAGITVIPSNAVTVDKYICADYSKLNFYVYKPLSVEAGWENDDFTKNLRTFVGEWRVHYFVKNNDLTAFLYGDVTDDLTTLSV